MSDVSSSDVLRRCRWFGAAVVAAFLGVLLTATSAFAIVAGQPVPGGWRWEADPASNAYAFVGRIQAPAGKRTQTCTASLIRSDLVLTASHCVSGYKTFEGFEITFGLLNKDRGGGEVRHPVSRGILGDAVGLDSGSRMALLQLDRPVLTIAPVRLARPGAADNALWRTGSTLTSVGWGVVDRNGPVSAELRSADVRIADTAVSLPLQNRGLMKATSVRGYPWSGDSGGPLLAGTPQSGFVQVGVYEVYSRTGDSYYNRVGLKDWDTILSRISPQ